VNPGTSWREKQTQKLSSFSHKKNPGIAWTRVREERIMNEEVRYHFFQIPDLDAFIV